MKIAIIFTALAEASSILVFRNLISELIKQNDIEIDLYYFDHKVDIEIECKSQMISFWGKLPSYDYDLVHSTGIRPDSYVFFNKSKFPPHTKFVTTIHSFIHTDLANKYNYPLSLIATKLWLYFLRRHDRVVVLTNTAKKYYANEINNTIEVVNNGRNKISNAPCLESDLSLLNEIKCNYKIIASHAVVSKIKGLDIVIKALPRLHNHVFIVFGEGPELENLKKLAFKLNVEDRCYFMGFRKCIERYFQYYNLYVMPSHSEGLPMALLEAVSNKTPCLTSDIPTFSEIFTNEEVPKFRLNDKNDFIVNVLAFDSKVYRDNAINRSYDRYLNFYTTEIMASNYRKIYEDLIKSQ